MFKRTFTPAILVLGLAALPLAACNNPEVRKESQEAADASKKAARETGEAVGTAGQAAGEAAADAADRTKRATADGSITAAIKTKLIADPEVKGLQIDVDTHNGVVTLTGRADTQAQKAEAEKLARGTDGVLSVINEIRVGK